MGEGRLTLHHHLEILVHRWTRRMPGPMDVVALTDMQVPKVSHHNASSIWYRNLVCFADSVHDGESPALMV